MLKVENYESYNNMSYLLLILSIIGFLPILYLYKYHRH